jgi:hypothetical protein
MLQLLEKQFSLKPNERSTGEVTQARDKLLLLARVMISKKWGELLFDWEDQYIHLELGPKTIQAAYSKADEFQFGKLLTQMASVTQDEIDDAYTKMNRERKLDPNASEHTGLQVSPSQRIGSLLVGAHLISPHMIGAVLRTQVTERTLRILALQRLSYTFEPKSKGEDVTAIYPYLDPTIPLEELLFHAFMWRTQIKVVDQVLAFFSDHHPILKLEEKFQFPENLAVVCRLSSQEAQSVFFESFRGKETPLNEWIEASSKQKAFTLRFVTAFLLTHLHLWTSKK